MKMLAIAVSAILLLVTGCSTSTVASNESHKAPKQSVTFTAEQAIAKVNHVYGAVFPGKPGTIEGVIHEGPLQYQATDPGRLQTKVRQVGENTYLVTFVEEWNSSTFPVKGNKTTGQYRWIFKVTPDSARIQSEGGDYPPQDTK